MNNLRSDDFQLSRGTRQGCPLSPILFALSLEPLTEAIWSNSNITGIQIASEIHKISLFADDTTLYLTNLERSLPYLMDLLNSFGKISGFVINQTKTELFPVHISDSLKKLVELNFGFK